MSLHPTTTTKLGIACPEQRSRDSHLPRYARQTRVAFKCSNQGWPVFLLTLTGWTPEDMSQASGKQVMSGLRAVKRDFSSNSVASSSQSSGPSEPSRQEKLTAQERRLKLIQDALNGVTAPPEKKNPLSGANRSSNSVASSATSSLKRPLASDSQAGPKKRQMPSSWKDNRDVTVYSSTRALSASSSVNNLSKAVISASSSGSSGKPASIFLSQEQTHILNLVEKGESLFYTGSAGELPNCAAERWNASLY